MNRQWCHTAGTAIVISHFVDVEAERMLAITQGFKIRFGRVLAKPHAVTCGITKSTSIPLRVFPLSFGFCASRW